jgi:hypothetical protein
MLSIPNPAALQFWRRIRNCDIDVPCDVYLGVDAAAEDLFLIGPGVSIACGTLFVGARSVDVDVQGDVLLNARECLQAFPDFRVRVFNEERGRLVLGWPGVVYPWAAQKYSALPGAAVLRTPRHDVLRKLILMFHKQRSRTEETVRNSRWSQEQLVDRDVLLKLAFDRGVLLQEGNQAVSMIQFNTKYDSLKTMLGTSPRLSDDARKFVDEFMGGVGPYSL